MQNITIMARNNTTKYKNCIHSTLEVYVKCSNFAIHSRSLPTKSTSFLSVSFTRVTKSVQLIISDFHTQSTLFTTITLSCPGIWYIWFCRHGFRRTRLKCNKYLPRPKLRCKAPKHVGILEERGNPCCLCLVSWKLAWGLSIFLTTERLREIRMWV